MTKKNTLILSIAVTALLSMAAMAYAGPGYGRGGCGGPGNGNGYFSQLSPEKQAAVEKIVVKYRGEQIKLRDQARAAHYKLEALVNSGKVDEKRIDALVSQLSDIRTKLWQNREAMSKEIEAETGLRFPGPMMRGGQGCGGNLNYNDCPAFGGGQGMGQGMGHGMGRGHGMGHW